jgi:hypothetical protein
MAVIEAGGRDFVRVLQGEIFLNPGGQPVWDTYGEDIFVFPGDNWRTSPSFTGDFVMEKSHSLRLSGAGNYRFTPNGLYRQAGGNWELILSVAAETATTEGAAYPEMRLLTINDEPHRGRFFAGLKKEHVSVEDRVPEMTEPVNATYLEDMQTVEKAEIISAVMGEQNRSRQNMLVLQRRSISLQKENMDRERAQIQARLSAVSSGMGGLRDRNLSRMRMEKRTLDIRYRNLLAEIRRIEAEIRQLAEN